jgi:high-affinity Fe2+/Pb2+ permease
MEPRDTRNFQFTNRAGEHRTYNEGVTRETQRPLLLFGGFALLFAAFVVVLLRVLPGTRTSFDYMVAGTFATALALIVIFLWALRRR